MKILKFGGSSVGSASRIRNVASLISAAQSMHAAIVVVVSAFQGVTDRLLKAGALASQCDSTWHECFESLRAIHVSSVQDLFSGARRGRTLKAVNETLDELQRALKQVSNCGPISAAQLDHIVAFGERLSALILSEFLTDQFVEAEYVDSRECVRTDDGFGRARVRLEITYAEIQRRLARIKPGSLPVVTGFIGSTEDGRTTTLGRGGSDYTATILGAALDATEVEIWTDVDGVLTADPRKVKGAFSIEAMTYEEAMEMAHFGAKVIYPPTIRPALQRRIPVRVLNSFNPSFPGTVIRGDLPPKEGFLATGLSSLDEIALLRVEGSGMIGVAGVAARLFGALARNPSSIAARAIPQSPSCRRAPTRTWYDHRHM